MRQGRLLGVALVVISACGYGSGPILAKGVYAAGTDWLTLLAWRFTLGAALTWAWLAARPAGRDAVRRLTRRQIAIFLAVGIVFAGNAATYYAAVQVAPVSLVALLLYVYPALVAVLATWFGEAFEGRRPWFALGIAVFGAALTIGGIRAGTSAVGVALAAASPLIYSAYILLAARVAGERRGVSAAAHRERAGTATPPVLATALMITGTWLIIMLLAVAAREPALPWQVAPRAWPGLIGIAVLSTVLAIQAFYAGVSRIGAAQAALVSTMEPVFTVILAVVVLDERLSPMQLVGALFVVAAVVLAQSGHGAAARAAVAPEA
jgi:drug/metabolite transporter (DMT)-like permease